MKRFFVALLGSMAGIWLSVLLAIFGLTVVFAAAEMSLLGEKGNVDIRRHSYLEINLNSEITDRPGKPDPIAMMRGEGTVSTGLNEIVGAIVNAADDNDIDGIVIYCDGASAGLAQRQSIVSALRQFREKAPTKWIYSYADFYTGGDYYVASSSADSLFLNPAGQIELSGLSATNLYYKGLLDRLGVEMEVVKVGTYKSAVEPYTRTEMSDPAREQMTMLLGNIWQSISTDIAGGRGVPADSVNRWADSQCYSLAPESYLTLGLADRLVYRHQFKELLADLTGCDGVDDLNPVTPAEYCKARNTLRHGDGKDAVIAVLYACGGITQEGGDGIVATEIVPEILDLADNDEIDGLVMYVNSGGGSAFASEQIWEALEQWKEITGKPFYVSMGDYAASGGYYISCGADRIFAQPSTITGSIGIFGLIPNMQTLLNDRLGITSSTVSTSPGGQFPSMMKPMTPSQRHAMQTYIDRGYDLFTRRCADGRHTTQDSIKLIAEGRVWDGREALRLELVDELGGLDDAVIAMAGHLNASSWTVKEYPERKTKWYDLLLEAGNGLKVSIVRSQLGEMAPVYDAVNSIHSMSPVQARMDDFTVNF